MECLKLARNETEQLISIRRDIHRHPETGFDVERTAALVAKHLSNAGIDVQTEIGKTGVVGDITVPGAQRRVALRADMDALPMQEMGNPPYKSTVPGKAHMCGHDGHTAMLLVAASIIAAHREQLKSSVRFLFQPHEEGMPGGAPAMIADGCLDGVDEIFGLHVWPSLDVGTYGICPGPAMAQADHFSITIHGSGGHAAKPQECIDPIVIGSQLVTACQQLVSRRISPLDPAVLSITQFHAGSTHNVIPETAEMTGTVRTYDPRVQQAIEKGMQGIADALSQSTGARIDFHYESGFPPLINHQTSAEAVRTTLAGMAGDHRITMPGEQVMYGEDFAYYVQKIPGCFVQLGCRNLEKGIDKPLHHSAFDMDEACLAYGAALHTALAFC